MPRTYPPEILTPGEAAALLRACDDRSWRGVRDKSLVALLYRTGLRISEALALEAKDVDLDSGAVRVLRGKGGRSRTVGIDPGGAAHVAAWLEKKGSLGFGTGPVFCDARGKRLRSGRVRTLFRDLGAKAGIAKRVHPHGLRHTHAAELREEGVDIGIISKQLGHRSIATTAHYLDHIAPVAVVGAMRGREWGAGG